jgi:hypothetical protein
LAVLQRLTQEGPQHFEENLTHLMKDSARLQQEPEFAGLHFNLEQTLETAAKQFSHFKGRLNKGVKKKDQEAIATAYYDYRVAVIRDLATPEFRQELHRRLVECATRLHTGSNADLLEMATFLKVLLGSESMVDEKMMPLGSYGLITAIYEETFNQAMLKLPGARDIVGDELHIIWSGQHRPADLNALNQAASAANTFAEFSNELETEPDLATSMRRQQEHLVDKLIRSLINEEIRFEPVFFTPAEIRLSIAKMESKHLKLWSLSRYFGSIAAFTFTNCITRGLVEIMTAQRTDEAVESTNAGASLSQMCWLLSKTCKLAPCYRTTIFSLQCISPTVMKYLPIKKISAHCGYKPLNE